ncbi:MAG: hypothetical protein JW888_01245, partial [Pirellulales bacterium]|nr:hypothetical protein [Pirellulales bacterium]
MHEPPSTKSSNFVIFVLLAFGVVMLHNLWFGQQNVARKQQEQAAAEAEAQPGEKDKQPGDQGKAQPG